MAAKVFRKVEMNQCNQCGHVFEQRGDEDSPRCPACRSRRWQEPKEKKRGPGRPKKEVNS